MLNFELKARISDYEKIIEKMINIGAVHKETMNQIDYYFQIGTEKTKIREINNQEIYLISYKRLEQNGRKDSNYIIKTLSREEKDSLFEKKPLLCSVDKTRQLWVYKHTRIHIDNVTDLGEFMELETVVKDISKNQALDEFNEVVSKLGIELKKTEAFSYSDLILNKVPSLN
ncbi:MAG: class IV adenylate cyclase [Patescibacteria group bacterium]